LEEYHQSDPAGPRDHHQDETTRPTIGDNSNENRLADRNQGVDEVDNASVRTATSDVDAAPPDVPARRRTGTTTQPVVGFSYGGESAVI
jgi:hypothetical protein